MRMNALIVLNRSKQCQAYDQHNKNNQAYNALKEQRFYDEYGADGAVFSYRLIELVSKVSKTLKKQI